MILTTTPTVEGRTIREYKGVVFGEVISGVNFFRDIAASIRDLVGGRSGSYEEELINARSQAMDEMVERAVRLGADAVIGIDIDYEVLGEKGGMLHIQLLRHRHRGSPEEQRNQDIRSKGHPHRLSREDRHQLEA